MSQDASETRVARFLSGSAVLKELGASIAAICFAVLWISGSFAAGQPKTDRPTVLFLALMAVATAFYYTSIVVSLRQSDTPRLRVVIWFFAVLCRLALLPSTPIHEVDLHRYIWDGAVVNAGVSPYRYPPQTVIEAAEREDQSALDPQLRRLVDAQARSDSLRSSLERVHYEWLPSPYPPVSQAVFALADATTPDDASPRGRMMVLKAWIVACDLATLWVVFGLLRHCGLHSGWAITYAWCPLVLKEFANSGHLDSIAVLLTSLSLLLLVRSGSGERLRGNPLRGTLPAALVWALAIGAKLYPLVLLPLFATFWFRRGGRRAAGMGLVASGVLSLGLLWTLIASGGAGSPQAETIELTPPPVMKPDQAPTPANPSVGQPAVEATDSAAGLRAFLQSWEMNDLLFMLVLENLRPHEAEPPHERPWFAFMSDAHATGVTESFRSALSQGPLESLGIGRLSDRRASFLLARLVTGVATLLLACVFAWRGSNRDATPEQTLRAAALTLVWFWLLCPTQNPWYWCWVVPLLPFVRLRAWHAVSGLVLLYYLRFWLAAHFAELSVLGSPYYGSNFFHFVVVPAEHGLVLLALACEHVWATIRRDQEGPPTD